MSNFNPRKFGADNIAIYNNIAIAIKFQSFSQVEDELESVMNSKATLVEIRFDYSIKLAKFFSKSSSNSKDFEITSEDVVKIFPGSVIEKLKNLSKIPIIFTLRNSDEGGACLMPEVSRIKILKYLMGFKPDYIDLESKIDINSLDRLYQFASEKKIKIIFSYHNWIKTPAIGKIREIIQSIISKCPGIKPKKERDQNIIKVIFTANHLADNHTALEICKEYAKKGYKVVCFCMGPEGIPSRVGSLLCGAFLSYASISTQTAPGQLNIKDFIAYYELAKQKGNQ